MAEEARRRADRILSGDYLDNLQSLSTADLRELRAEGEELEAELSYVRRLLHGKLDIFRHELERRKAGGEGGLEALVQRLPSILSDGRPGDSGRHIRVLVPRNAAMQRREVERIVPGTALAHIAEHSITELSEMIDRLAEAEGKMSEQRRTVQNAMDTIRAELVRRYREGQEDPTAIFSA